MNIFHSGRNRLGKRPSKGFTIIEIIAAIVILAILASLSVNVMRDYKIRQNVEAARQQFVNSLTAAMAAAAKYNATYQVIWNASDSSISSCVEKSDATGSATCDDDNTEFNFSLKTLSEAYYFLGGVNKPSKSGNAKILSVTPYGKVSFNNSSTTKIYFADGNNSILTSQKLCIGAEIGRNGTVEILESSTTSESCPK